MMVDIYHTMPDYNQNDDKYLTYFLKGNLRSKGLDEHKSTFTITKNNVFLSHRHIVVCTTK